jgi:polyferredoxin
MAAFYGITFVINAVVGRLFCGWGCPVAQVSRFGEEVEIARRSGKGLRGAVARALLFGAALSASVLLWWVDPRVLVEGSALEAATALAVFLGLVGATLLHGRFWRWSFCKQACPIGLYYSIVAPDRIYGIVFDADRGPCKECRLCDRVCPVDLDPRDLSRARDGIGGLAIDGLPGENHCLRCGDCIRACEWVFDGAEKAALPLRFGFTRTRTPAPAAPLSSSDPDR